MNGSPCPVTEVPAVSAPLYNTSPSPILQRPSHAALRPPLSGQQEGTRPCPPNASHSPAMQAPLDARLDLPDGPNLATAVFAHCFTCGKDIAAARRIAARLTTLGIAVLRFDFTGLGHSGGEFALKYPRVRPKAEGGSPLCLAPAPSPMGDVSPLIQATAGRPAFAPRPAGFNRLVRGCAAFADRGGRASRRKGATIAMSVGDLQS